MRIHLLHRYSGTLTNEKKMYPGEHDVTEDLANYLITNGHAVIVDMPPTVNVSVYAYDESQEHGVIRITDSGSSVSEIALATDETKGDFGPLPEITEDVVTTERTSEPKRNKRR
jgi:hypothetical protein